MLILKDVADVRAGYPFRGSVPIAESGSAQVIQMRDISADGAVDWVGLSRTELPSNRSPDWLQDGDVLFAARGARNYAVCLPAVPAQTVCSQYFFVLRCKARSVTPAYLAWFINRAPAQRYLLSNAEGSDQLSIRRGVLEHMPLAMPPLARQAQIVGFTAAALAERRCLEALIHNRERQLDALANQLLAEPSHKG